MSLEQLITESAMDGVNVDNAGAIIDQIDIWTSTVKTKSASGRGSSKKLELYGVKKLRELILELAVRGKLVPQDPSDEPASLLVELADRAKDRLVAKKLIRKQKSLEPIDKEEMPFSLPKSWAYHRLGSLGLVGSSSRVQKKDWTDNGVPFYRAREIVKLSKNGFVENELFISEDLFSQLSKSGITPEENDIMFTGVGTIGVPHVVKAQERFYFKDASVLIFKNLAGVNADYLSMYMRSPLWNRDIHEDSMGTTVHTLTIARANNVVTPVPPIKEQHRIVAKVDELMTLCDQLEQQTEASIEAHQVLVTTLLDSLLLSATRAEGSLTNSANADDNVTAKDGGNVEAVGTSFEQNWQMVAEHFDTLFTTIDSIDQLKQTILQLAVMGKLVPQDPFDEPAAKLLERIAEEKAKLIKEKKIKKQKALPPIADDEKPFELPQGWEWCHINELCATENGDRSSRYPNSSDLVDEGVPFFGAYDIADDKLVANTDLRFITEKKFSELSNGKLRDKDFIMLLRGSVGKTAQFERSIGFNTGFINAQMLIIRLLDTSSDTYLNCYFKSKLYWNSIEKVKSGAVIQQMPASKVIELILPLPPLNEQKKIAAKVDELLSVCEYLKARVKDSQMAQLKFTDAIVEQAV